jgi:hypothetical protein
MVMKTLMCGAATALVLLSAPALAQDKTLDPNGITVESQRAPLQLNDKQRSAIQDGLETENTEQKAPPNFEAKVGDALPAPLGVDAMPGPLLQREPSLKQYGYVKLAKDVLVVDPMKKTIIAVVPLKTPTSSKAETPTDWAKTRGRELTGQAPESTDATEPAHEPAGDAGDKANGNEATTKEKQH